MQKWPLRESCPREGPLQYFVSLFFFADVTHIHTHTLAHRHSDLHVCVCVEIVAAYDNCRLHCVCIFRHVAFASLFFFGGLFAFLLLLLFPFALPDFCCCFSFIFWPFIDIVNVIVAIPATSCRIVFILFFECFYFYFYLIAICFCWRVSFSLLFKFHFLFFVLSFFTFFCCYCWLFLFFGIFMMFTLWRHCGIYVVVGHWSKISWLPA